MLKSDTNPRRSAYAPNGQTKGGFQIPSSTMAVVVRYALDKGMQRDEIEAAAGFSVSDIFKPDRYIPAIAGPRLLLRLIERGIGDATPLDIATTAPFSFFGGTEKSILFASTGREGLMSFANYMRLFHNGLSAEYSETAGSAIFSFSDRYANLHRGGPNEIVLLMLARLMRATFGRYGTPIEVCTSSKPSAPESVYRHYFKAPMRFATNDKAFRLIFRKSDMSWRSPAYDADLAKLASQQLNERLDAYDAGLHSQFDLLRSAAQRAILQGRFRVEHVAQEASMSVRSAQRLATESGTTISALINEARFLLLEELLSQNQRTPASELARRAGYGDERALRRAILKSAGVTLSEFRSKPRLEDRGA
ncbi:MAG: AraC family transcriptional regulator ligand-binding domain-containing protein [Pseudomonadota bacterium]